MWYDSMQNAIKQTIIISEILDTRTRHLIQVSLFANILASHSADVNSVLLNRTWKPSSALLQ